MLRVGGVVAMLVAAAAHAAPDPRDELTAIGKKALSKPGGGAAPAICTVPAKSEQAELRKRALTWIDQQFPDEKQSGPSDIDGMELVFNPGCKHGSAAIVDVSQDRVTKKKGGGYPTRRNFVLRIDGDKIESIAARTSSPSMNWMEWADEGRLRMLTVVDLDGDGANDIVWSDVEHEGGAVSTFDELWVRFATGKTTRIATVKNLGDTRVIAGQLVVAGQQRTDTRALYACVGKNLGLAPCAATVPLQREADKVAAASQLAQLAELPDRDQVTAWLATIGAKARPATLSALPATTPQQTAERHVAAFLASKQLDDAFHEVFDQPHPEASAFFDQLATKLGDRPCTPAPLDEAARARLEQWIKKQDKKPEQIELTAECSPYAWAEWNHHGDPDRNEILVALDGPEPVRVAKLKPEPSIEGPPSPGHNYDGRFFRHGDTTVGFVIRNQNLSVIANGKVVAQSHGEISQYAFDARWHERAFDVIVDSGTLWHPTPTGLEKLDRELVKQRETFRVALARVLQGPPSNDPVYLAALRTLGADPKLVAECKAL